MNKKLYRVKVTLYVMAENESEACVAATNARFDIFECVAKKAEQVERGWDNAVPYNADDDRTCAEILASQQFDRPADSFVIGTGQRRPGMSTISPYANL